MRRCVRREVWAFAMAALLSVGLSGCSKRQNAAGPQPGQRRGPTPRRVAPGAEERIPITAYFADSATAALAPVQRDVRSDPEAGADDALQALIEGPMPDEGLEGVMPDGTELEEVTVDGRTARVRMNAAFYDNFPRGGAFGGLCLYGIVNTLTSIPGIDEVIIETPGRQKLLGELDVAEPLRRNDDLVAAKP